MRADVPTELNRLTDVLLKYRPKAKQPKARKRKRKKRVKNG